jgi:DNA-binding SARP family transcriptional activator
MASRWPRDAVLLAWLVIEGPTSRERLPAMLWPASGLAQALNTLRQRLFQLKKLLGMDVAIGLPTLALAPRKSACGGSIR